MLFVMCAIGVEPVKVPPLNVSRPLPADYPKAILCLPPASALAPIRVDVQVEPEPTSALTALGVEIPDLSPVTTEVAEILRKCEAASRLVKTSKITVNRTVYNLVFETETRMDGVLSFDAPDKQSIDLRRVKIPTRMKAVRLGRNGNPFLVESGPDESWILTKDEVASGNVEEKSFLHCPRPTRVPDDASWRSRLFNLADMSFPFLFDLRADQIRTDWNVTLKSLSEQQIGLKAIPRTDLLKRNFSECLILIDNETWQVTAVKYFDPSRNLETVYKLGERVINQPLPADCFDPISKWKGFRQFKPD